MGARHYRTHTRYPVDIPVTVVARARGLAVSGRLVNLGRGGAACRLEAPLRIGEPVTLHVLAESPHVLAAEVAWVAWGESTSVRLGLSFADDQESALTLLLEFLDAPSDVGT